MEALEKKKAIMSIDELSRHSAPSLLRCPDGRCGYTTTDVGSYVDHRMKSFANVLGDEFEKQLNEVAQKIPSAETIRKIASAPECVDGLCNAVMKRLEEKEAADKEARRKQLLF